METILIMIVVGVISMIFGKTKNNQGYQGRNPFPRRLEQIQTRFKDFSDSLSKDTTLFTAEEKTSNMNKLETEYLQVRQESETGRMGMAAARKQTERREAIPNQEENKPYITDTLEAQTVINGVIWSEILGEPRAKKSYRVKKRSN
ncbi:hypothetical protein [Neobacillus cucumis]|uniref:Uncharacterized protein n=1 Tax=Neobacillus cucumis TaxID=1740721 RepID=A0A2N5H6R0_9BACI|nr:hypothetical protein [Neobacillus cucumis]PLS01194.1 hypothetical protein CVD27_25870 [Neobacillus cucumis]